MTKRSAASAVALCAFGLLLAGCLLPAEDGGINADPNTSQSVGAAPSPSRESLEGAFEYETMDEYVSAVVPMIEQWVETTWPGMRLPRVVYVPEGAAGREGCLGVDGRPASYTSRSYEYCAPDNTIYVGQDTLWEFYTETGDAGPAVGLAHEIGHHIQVELNFPPARTTDQSIRVENQADCLAGAWTRYTDEQGWLEYPDDIEDIRALFPIIGAAEGPERDHGTTEERQRAFVDGFEGGPSACGVPN